MKLFFKKLIYALSFYRMKYECIRIDFKLAWELAKIKYDEV